VQAVLRTDWGRAAPRIWLGTIGSQPVRGDDALPGFAAAVLWGLGRVLSQEHPAHLGGLVDLDPDASVEAQARELCLTITSKSADKQVAFRDGQRHALDLVRTPERPGVRAFHVDPAGTYLVTGGLGGLGRKVAEWLAAHGATSLVLTSRRDANEEEI